MCIWLILRLGHQATPDNQDTVQGTSSSSADDLLPIEEELVHRLCYFQLAGGHAITLELFQMSESLRFSQRSRRRSKKGKVNVVAPQVQKAYGQQPPTTEGVLEGYYLAFLGIFFVVILFQGLFIALSVRPRPILSNLPALASLHRSAEMLAQALRSFVC